MRPFLISAILVTAILLFLIITTPAYPQTGPVISNITISSLKYNSVTISWLTNAPAVCKIEYGQTASYGITTSYSSKFVTSHQRAISGLKPYTTYHYRIIAKNKSSAITTSADFIFTTKDRYPPTGSITINNNAPYTNSVEVILNISATDTGGAGLDKMYFSNDNIAWSGPIEYATKTSWKLKGGSSGSRKVYAKFTDKSGNVSSVVSDSITLDLTRPTGTIKINNNAASTTVKDVVLNLSAKDTYSGIDTTNGQMCFSNDGITYTSPEPYKTTRKWQLEGGSGNKTVWVKFKDRAGNWSDPIADTIKYIPSDNIPPTIVLNQPSTPTNKDVTLSYTVSDNITPQDKITVTGNNSPYIKEGDYSVTLTAQDEAGNTSASNIVKFTIDKTPPPIIITSPQNNSILNTPTITLQGTIDGVSFTETRTLTEGANTITKIATDAAGNTAIKSITITLDTTPPEIIITSPEDGALVNTPTITLQGTIDGASFSESRTLQEVGKNIITKEATDLAGNKGSASVIVIYAPGELIGPQGGEVVSFDGRIRLIIPQGALSEPTYISISSLDPTIFEEKMPDDYSSIVVVKCEPMGLILLKEAQLIIKLDSQQVPGTDIELGLYNYGLDEVEPLGQLCPVASDGFTVNFTLWHFSDYLGLRNMISQGAPIGAGVQVPLPDLLTGSYSYEVPITVPPGRAKMQPSISLSYNSSNSNSWTGYGWNLNPGYIMRSTKHGIPSYNDTKDTFILVSGNSSTELIHLVDNLYQARVESEFSRFFKEQDDSWRVVQKDGTVLRFGTSLDSKETQPSGTFSWHLTKVIDNNGNYISLSYTKDEGKSYLSRIEYTGNENTYFSPTHSVNFYLEDRNDVISSYISGSKILMKKRLKTIEVLVGYNLIWQYELDYEYAPETNRSLLKSVCKYTSDNNLFPEQKFYYQNHDGRQQ